MDNSQQMASQLPDSCLERVVERGDEAIEFHMVLVGGGEVFGSSY